MFSLKKLIIKIVSQANASIQSYRKCEEGYITYAGGWDGSGAQMHSIISIQVFAQKFKLTYVHTPMKNIEHFKGDREKWSQKWEEFFSLGKGEIPIGQIDKSKLRSRYIKHPALVWKKHHTLYSVSNCHNYMDMNPSFYLPYLQNIRQKFYSNKENLQNNRFLKKKISISIHVRRGDVTSAKNVNRYSSNLFLIEKLLIVLNVIESKGLGFQLFICSQGEKEDFQEFEVFKPKYLLNNDEFETFNYLVTADILFMAKSSFSYVAGLLNEGMVLYEPYWHKPLPSWIVLTNNDRKLQDEIQSGLLKRINNEILHT